MSENKNQLSNISPNSNLFNFLKWNNQTDDLEKISDN